MTWRAPSISPYLAGAVRPFLVDLAPLGAVLTELFVGPAPLKGRAVPDLASFVRRTVAGGHFGDEEKDEEGDEGFNGEGDDGGSGGYGGGGRA